MEIDVICLLKDFAKRYEEETFERQVICQTIAEVEKLRRSLDFQIQLASDNNKSRLRLLDVVDNCRELFTKACVDIAIEKNNACNYCRNKSICNDDFSTDCFVFDFNNWQKQVFETK